MRFGPKIGEDVCGTGVLIDVVIEVMDNGTKEREKKDRKVEEEGMLIYLRFSLLRQSHKFLRLFHPSPLAKNMPHASKSNNDTTLREEFAPECYCGGVRKKPIKEKKKGKGGMSRLIGYENKKKLIRHAFFLLLSDKTASLLAQN